ncbi:hypothetical protein L208DRAFT_1074342, partial [Tricholoma matsutake]
LADWMCQINKCVYPLDHEGLNRSFTCFIGSIPVAWIIAQNQMSKINLTRVGAFYSGPADLLLSQSIRWQNTEKFIQSILLANFFPPSEVSQDTQLWGMDGSMIPTSAGPLDDKSVTSAITGPHTIVMKLLSCNVSILHGKLVGIIGGLILSDSHNNSAVIYTDHLNSTRLIDDSKTSANIEACLCHMNGCSYYKWILHLISTRQTVIRYTRGHSAESSTPSILNVSADYYASKSQHIRSYLHYAPLPTFFMDPFTYFTPIDGWIESNIRGFTDRVLSDQSSRKLELNHGLHLVRSWPALTYPYLCSLSCYSALVQLYACSGQLPTAMRLHSQHKINSYQCHFGCHDAPEDEHHLFVECPYFAELWSFSLSNSSAMILVYTELKCLLPSEIVQCLMSAAKSLFSDDSAIWPLHHTAFYLVGSL